jgi:hypothetical protein
MATYDGTLPAVFPYRILVPIDMVPVIISLLSTPYSKMPNGSSFAVTSDAKQNFRYIWLSEASYRIFGETFGPTFSIENGNVMDFKERT